MSMWLLISIGCMYTDSSFKKVDYCAADKQILFQSKSQCLKNKGYADRCIEFKKGTYWITYPIKIKEK